jgi:ATP-dependent DNA helicase RecG
MRQRIFVSGVQKELKEERAAVKEVVTGSRELNDCFDVFLFEDLPARGHKGEKAYLKEAGNSDIYLGIFGYTYGEKDKDGFSATERELRHFLKKNPDKEALIYIKGKDDQAREKEMQKLIKFARNKFVCPRFAGTDDLKVKIMKSLLSCMGESGQFSNEPFDERLCRGASYKDIDDSKIDEFLDKRAEKLKVGKPAGSLKEILTNTLKAARKTEKGIIPINAGILFFGKNPQNFISQSEIRAARFKGTDRQYTIDSAEIGGPVYSMLEETEKFIIRNTRLANKIVEFKRIDIPEYPYEAIREAVINAIAHRDYTRAGAPVMLAIFDDRVEINSPGGLLPGLKVGNLEGHHNTRNKKICAIFHETKDMERFGTGIGKMKRLMKAHGLKEPELKPDSGYFTITFFGPGERILDLVDNIPKERQTDLRELGLNERQIQALSYIVNDKQKITVKKYLEQLPGISEKTAKRDIKILVEKGMIKKIGFKKGAYFEAK